MRHLFPFIFCLLVCISQSSAQSTVIYDSRVEKQIQFTPPYKNIDPGSVEFAKSLNTIANKLRQNANPALTWKQSVQLMRVSAFTYRLMVYADEVKTMPRLAYKELDLSNAFQPQAIDLKVEINNAKGKFRRVFEHAAQPFEQMRSKGLVFDISDTLDLAGSKVLITYSKAIVDQTQVKNAQELMAVADTLADYKGEMASQWVRLVAPFDNQNVDSVKAAILYVQQASDFAKRQPPYSIAHLPTYSVAEHNTLQNEITALNEALAKRIVLVQLSQKNLDRLLIEKADKFYRFGKRIEAHQLYLEALYYNELNELALHRVTQYEVEKGKYEPALRRFAQYPQILKALRYQRLLEKAGRGVETILIKSNRLGQAQESNRYVALLDSICKRYPGYRCPDLSTPQASNPNRAEYQVLINNARSAVSRNEMKEAESYSDQAVAYSERNSMPINTVQSAKVFQLQVRKRYGEQLAYQARDLFRKGKDSVAMVNLYMANEMNARHELGLNAILEKTASAYVPAFLKKEIERGFVVSRTDKAEGDTITARAIRYATALNLYNSLQFQSSIQGLAKAANSGECKKPQQLFEENLAKSDALQKQGKFLEARVFLLKCLEISSQNPACYINNGPATLLLKTIQPPAQYQDMVMKASNQVKKENFDSAFVYHTLSQEFYSANNIAKFKLSPLSNHLFFTTSQKPDLAIYGIEYYLKTGKVDSALGISQTMATKGYSKNYWAYVSEKLGEALARRDHRIQPKPNPEENLKTYTANDRRYKDFIKGYQKVWNDLGR